MQLTNYQFSSFDVLKFIIIMRIKYDRMGLSHYNCLRDWSYRAILKLINESIETKLILVIYNQVHQIVGLGIGRKIEGNQIHIISVIADNLKVVKQLMQGTKEILGNDIIFTANRHGLKRKWGMDKLSSAILN